MAAVAKTYENCLIHGNAYDPQCPQCKPLVPPLVKLVMNKIISVKECPECKTPAGHYHNFYCVNAREKKPDNIDKDWAGEPGKDGFYKKQD